MSSRKKKSSAATNKRVNSDMLNSNSELQNESALTASSPPVLQPPKSGPIYPISDTSINSSQPVFIDTDNVVRTSIGSKPGELSVPNLSVVSDNVVSVSTSTSPTARNLLVPNAERVAAIPFNSFMRALSMKQPTALVTASHSVSPSRSPIMMVPVTNISALADIVDKTIAPDDKKTSNTSTSTDNVSCVSVILKPVDIHDDIKCEQPINNPVVNINTPSSIVVDQSTMLILPLISDMLLTTTITTGTLAGHIQSSCATLVTPNGPMFSIHDIAIDTHIITAASNPVRMPSVVVPPFSSTPGQLSVPSSTLASISTSESSFGQTATFGGSMRLALVSYAAINLARRLLMRVIVLGSWPTILLGSGLPEVSLLLRVMRHLVLLALWTGFLYYLGYHI